MQYRRGMQGFLSLAVGTALLVSACAPSAPPASPTAATKAAPQATTAPAAKSSDAASKPAAAGQPKVNRLVIAIAGPTVEGNAPGRDYSSPDSIQLRPMYEKLLGLDPKTGKFVPQLATEWSLEPDGKSYRFKLRRGVQFQKGHGEFTAKDVVWSWQDITVPDSQHGNAALFRTLVENVEVVNDYEVVFRMKEPDADFLNNVSEMVGGMEIQSKAHYDKVGKAPTLQDEPIVGTGPYQFKERIQAQYIRFERVPHQHWRVQPDFPELELRFVREPSTRLAQLLAGEAHMTSIPNDLQKDVLARGGYTVVKSNVAGLRTFMPFLCCYHNDLADASKGAKHPESPYMDVRVRQALNHAVNRDEINKAFFGGKAETMFVPNQHPTLDGWKPEWQKVFQETWAYDVNKARQLLTEAGYGPSKPLRLQMIISRLTDVPESEDVVEAVAGYFRAVGVEVELSTPDPTTHNTKRRQFGYDQAMDIRSTASHQLVGWRVYNTSRHGIRGSAVEVWEIDELYKKAHAELDDAKRAAIWQQMGDRALTSYQQISLFWLPTEMVVNSSIVADYQFPGNISGSWTHLEGIKAVK